MLIKISEIYNVYGRTHKMMQRLCYELLFKVLIRDFYTKNKNL